MNTARPAAAPHGAHLSGHSLLRTTGKVGPTTMREQNYVSTAGVIATTLWTTTAALMASAWGILFLDPLGDPGSWRIASMLGMTSATLACVAVVCHIKLYALGVTNLVRVTSGLQPTREENSLRSVPR